MIKFNKKIAVFVLCFSLLGVSFQSKAILPILVAAGLVAADGGLTAAGFFSSAAVGVGLAGLIGQKLGMLDLTNPSTGDDIRLPLTDLPRDRPSRSTDGLSPTAAPVLTGVTYNSSGHSYPSQSSACSALIASAYPNGYNFGSYMTYVATTSVIIGTAPNQALKCYADQFSDGNKIGTVNSEFEITQTGTSSCPSGYTQGQNGCTLTKPQAVPDGHFDIEAYSPSAGLVLYRPIDGESDSDAGITLSQGAALFSMLHPDYVDGYPAGYWDNNPNAPRVSVSVDPNGGTTGTCPYQTCIPIPGLPGHFRISALSNTASGAQAVVIDVNKSSGVVDQATTVPLNGQIIREGATYIDAAGVSHVVAAGQIVLVQATGGTYTQVTQAAAPAASINIPTDYARSGEAATAATAITSKLSETEPTTDLVEPVLTNPLSSYFNPLRSWTPPSVNGQCPTGSFEWNNHTYGFDAMCTLFNDNLTLIRGAMGVIFSLSALVIVLRA